MEQRQLIRQKVCDTAEPWEICQKLLETGWERKKLWSGDYWFFAHDYKKVGITRKSVDDLLGSLGGSKMPDGKRRYPLPKQLEEMLDQYQILIFLLEGSWKMVRPTQSIVSSRGIEYYTWNMIWNFLRRWQDKGFTLELTINEGHTIQRLNELYALYQKPTSLSAKSRQYTDDRILSLPSGTRGTTGIKVIENFKTLQAIANASVEELETVNGIGQKKSELIYHHFHRE